MDFLIRSKKWIFLVKDGLPLALCLIFWASDITARSFSAHIGKHKLGATSFQFSSIWQHTVHLMDFLIRSKKWIFLVKDGLPLALCLIPVGKSAFRYIETEGCLLKTHRFASPRPFSTIRKLPGNQGPVFLPRLRSKKWIFLVKDGLPLALCLIPVGKSAFRYIETT
jgi:hypothetical protein